jgi:hypothetical protein
MLEEKHGEKCINPIFMCHHEEKFRRDANELKLTETRNKFVYFYLYSPVIAY